MAEADRELSHAEAERILWRLPARHRYRMLSEWFRCLADECREDHQDAAADWNARYRMGDPVRYWPGVREGEGTESRLRSAAWVLGSGEPVVKVDGYAGGIALTHVEPLVERSDPQQPTPPGHE